VHDTFGLKSECMTATSLTVVPLYVKALQILRPGFGRNPGPAAEPGSREGRTASALAAPGMTTAATARAVIVMRRKFMDPNEPLNGITSGYGRAA
jgi:hypothetical protein